MSVKRGDGVGAGAGAGAGVGVYLFLKECCFKVRIRNRVDTYRSSKILFFFHDGLQLLFGLFESSSADNYVISFKSVE